MKYLNIVMLVLGTVNLIAFIVTGDIGNAVTGYGLLLLLSIESNHEKVMRKLEDIQDGKE